MSEGVLGTGSEEIQGVCCDWFVRFQSRINWTECTEQISP